MRAHQIDNLCDVVAIRYGIPRAWVRHHIDQKAGRPCPKCGGSGRWGDFGRCFRCQGTGGRGRKDQVENALQWVEENIDKVRTLGARRDTNRVKRAAKKVASIEEKVKQWKQDNPRHWWALENMEASEFRTSLINQLESGKSFSTKQLAILWERAGVMEGLDTWKEANPRHWWALENMEPSEFRSSMMSRLNRFGELTEKQMAVLWSKAGRIEDEVQDRIVDAPARGTKASWVVSITDAAWGENRWGDTVFKVSFTAEEGWHGHFDTVSSKTEALLMNRTTNRATLTAAVKWARKDRAILGGRVKVELG